MILRSVEVEPGASDSHGRDGELLGAELTKDVVPAEVQLIVDLAAFGDGPVAVRVQIEVGSGGRLVVGAPVRRLNEIARLVSVGCIVQAQDDEPVHAAAIGAVAAPDDPLARDLADTPLNEVVLRDNEPVVLLRDDADGDGATATTPPHGDVARLGLGERHQADGGWTLSLGG